MFWDSWYSYVWCLCFLFGLYGFIGFVCFLRVVIFLFIGSGDELFYFIWVLKFFILFRRFFYLLDSVRYYCLFGICLGEKFLSKYFRVV